MRNYKLSEKNFIKQRKLLSFFCFIFYHLIYFTCTNLILINLPKDSPRKVLFLSSLPKNEYKSQSILKTNEVPNSFKKDEKEFPVMNSDSYFVAGIILEPTTITPYYGVKMKIYLRKLKRPVNEENFDIITSIIYDNNYNNIEEQKRLQNLEEKEIKNIKDKFNIKNYNENFNFIGKIRNSKIIRNKRFDLDFEKHINQWELPLKDFYENGIIREYNYNNDNKESIDFSLSFNCDFKLKNITNLNQLKYFKININYGKNKLKLETFDVSKKMENIFLESMEEGEGTNFVITENERFFDKNDPYGLNKALLELSRKLKKDKIVDYEEKNSKFENYKYGDDDVDGNKNGKNNIEKGSENNIGGNDGKGKSDKKDKKSSWKNFFGRFFFCVISLVKF